MEKKKWLWKRRSLERSPGETESSESISSHSERFSDEQDGSKVSPVSDTQSLEVTSKSLDKNDAVNNDTIRSLTEKLSAALVNVSAKDDLVKQHVKVAEEAVAGWEKAENEVLSLKKKYEIALQKNSTLEDRVSHLDVALKECVRQLRLAREEQEEKIHEAVEKKSCEWESAKSELENQICELKMTTEAAKSQPPTNDPDVYLKLDYLEQENVSLKLELLSQSEELEIRTIERDLSTQAAETASKQHLESIKKVAKLEAECRRLKAMASKYPSFDHKPSVASTYVESLTDSQSDSGERLSAVELDARKISSFEPVKNGHGSSDTWASALIAELDQFKNDKAAYRNLPASAVEIDLMDDFLEMEQLAALPEIGGESHQSQPEITSKQFSDVESSLKAELEIMVSRVSELEEKLKKMEAEKVELEVKLGKMEEGKFELEVKLGKMEEEKVELEGKLGKMKVQKSEQEMALSQSLDKNKATELELRQAQLKLDELQAEVAKAKESKQQIEFQLTDLDKEARAMCVKMSSLETELVKERVLSAEVAVKCKALEDELSMKKQEVEHQQTEIAKVSLLQAELEKERVTSGGMVAKCKELEEELSVTREEVELHQASAANNTPKINEEDLAVAAGKLAECQKTIASLGKQLKSLATLEDFLIDTGSIPELPAVSSLMSRPSGEPWKLHSNETFSPTADSSSSRVASGSSGLSVNKNEGNSPPSSSSSTSSTVRLEHVNPEKNRNGFAKFFSRSKNGLQLEI